MKKIVQYQCEICKRKYETEEHALNCEAQGRFETSIFKQGLMFEYYHNDFVGIFAFPEDCAAEKNSHYSSGNGMWACRSPKYSGDSLGKERCGGNESYKSSIEGKEQFIKYHHITKEKTTSPEFKRMVKYLKSLSITPSYFDEKGHLNIVP